MKTLIIYNDCISEMQSAIFDGDLSHFDGVVVNSMDNQELQEEFCNWMFEPETGEFRFKDWTTGATLLNSKQWDAVAICTFLP